MRIMPFSLLRNIKCLPITFQPQQFLCLAFKASSLHLYSRTFLCPSQAKPLPWPKHRLFFSFSASLFLATPSPHCIMVPTQTAPNSQHNLSEFLSPQAELRHTSFHWQLAFPVAKVISHLPCSVGHYLTYHELPRVSITLICLSSFLPTELQRGPICLISVSPEQLVQLLTHRRGSINAGWIILEKLFENVFLIFTSDSHFSFEWIPPLAPWYLFCVCVLASSGA